MTCSQAAGVSLTGLFLSLVIDRIGLGAQYLPLLARIAYELASVIGVTSPVPSTALGRQGSFLPSPPWTFILFMVFQTFLVPTLKVSDANAVLIDWAVALRNGIGLPPMGKSLRTSHGADPRQLGPCSSRL